MPAEILLWSKLFEMSRYHSRCRLLALDDWKKLTPIGSRETREATKVWRGTTWMQCLRLLLAQRSEPSISVCISTSWLQLPCILIYLLWLNVWVFFRATNTWFWELFLCQVPPRYQKCCLINETKNIKFYIVILLICNNTTKFYIINM